MDKKNKFLVAGLIVLAVLYFSALGAGLAPKNRQNMTEDQYTAKFGKEGGWEKSLGQMMEPFGPRLKVGELQSICKPTDNAFMFNKTTSLCKITIPKSDERYRKATLRVTKGVIVKIPASKKNQSQTTRGTVTYLQAAPPLKFQAQNLPKTQTNVPALELRVKYVPAGKKDDSEAQPWIRQDLVKLTVLPGGGALTLECFNCEAGRAVRVEFE